MPLNGDTLPGSGNTAIVTIRDDQLRQLASLLIQHNETALVQEVAHLEQERAGLLERIEQLVFEKSQLEKTVANLETRLLTVRELSTTIREVTKLVEGTER